ncbi:MAG: hypothetical protein L0G57_02220 [Acinetobacter sp.]|nr:hypothetical protein [Acinetobacter sp.]
MDIEIKKYMNPRYIICAMTDSYFINLIDLVAWADTVIDSVNIPPEWLVTISLGTNLSDINYSIRTSLANDNILDHNLIDSLFIGFCYIRYKNDEINYKELDGILSNYFVADKNFFNEDDLFTYFYEPKSNSDLVNSINLEFVRCENICKKALEYFYSDDVCRDLNI